MKRRTPTSSSIVSRVGRRYRRLGDACARRCARAPAVGSRPRRAADRPGAMIFTQSAISGIASGRITLAFRRWEQLRVKPGSLIRSSLGVVEILSADAIGGVEQISAADARCAGFATVAELMTTVDKKSRGGSLYRIGVRYWGEDPRRSLRQRTELDPEELAELGRRLARMDANEPWTRAYLELIAGNPGRVARELAPQVGLDRDAFKIRVRRLKDLGLTESLDVGYRISPRGRAFLAADAG